MLFSLRQLEYFVATVDAGSVTEAAQSIPVAQSSVSAAIAQLEAALGVKLLIRHHAQGISPTPEGRRFVGHARALLRQAGDLERFAFELTNEVSGELDLGCLVTLAPLVTPRLSHEFQRLHPGVRVSLVEAGQQEIVAQLRDGRLSIAVTYDLDLERDVSFERLAELPPHAVFPAGHPLAGASSVRMEDLVEHPLVLLDLPHSRDYFHGLFLAAGLRPTIAQRSRQPEVIRTLVANGFGYTIINARPAVNVALDGRALATVPIAGVPRAMTLGLASLRATRRTRLCDAFSDHCRAAIAAGTFPGLEPRPTEAR